MADAAGEAGGLGAHAWLRTQDSVQRALEIFALQHVEVMPVVSSRGEFAGLLDRRAILGVYRRRMADVRNGPW